MTAQSELMAFSESCCNASIICFLDGAIRSIVLSCKCEVTTSTCRLRNNGSRGFAIVETPRLPPNTTVNAILNDFPGTLNLKQSKISRGVDVTKEGVQLRRSREVLGQETLPLPSIVQPK